MSKDTGRPIRRIESVTACPETFSVNVEWADGIIDVVDLTGVIRKRSELRPLRQDHQAFRRVAVGGGGACISWGDGMEIGSYAMELEAHRQQEQLDAAFIEAYMQGFPEGETWLAVTQRELASQATGWRKKGEDRLQAGTWLLDDLHDIVRACKDELSALSDSATSQSSIFKALMYAISSAKRAGAPVALVPLPLPLAQDLEQAFEAIAYGETLPILQSAKTHGKRGWTRRRDRIEILSFAYFHQGKRGISKTKALELISTAFGQAFETYGSGIRNWRAPQGRPLNSAGPSRRGS